MANKYFDDHGNSLYPDTFDKEDRAEQILLQKVNKEKRDKTRPKPSDKFINQGPSLSPEKRMKIIDLAGKLCDEEMFGGRFALCQQFAILVKYMLKKENIEAKIYTGDVSYFDAENEFTWKHYWVEINENEIIDCNVDVMIDNPEVPAYLEPTNYWGLNKDLPNDRTFQTRSEFTDAQAKELENYDPETLKWKNRIDGEY
jgi:hypothetical protein